MAERFGGKYSPDGSRPPAGLPDPVAAHPFDGRRVSRIGFRSNALFLLALARRMLDAGFEEVQTLPGPSVEFCAVATMRPAIHRAQINTLMDFMGV